MSSYWDGPEFKGRMDVVRHVVRSASHNPVIRFNSYQGDENQQETEVTMAVAMKLIHDPSVEEGTVGHPQMFSFLAKIKPKEHKRSLIFIQ